MDTKGFFQEDALQVPGLIASSKCFADWLSNNSDSPLIIDNDTLAMGSSGKNWSQNLSQLVEICSCVYMYIASYIHLEGEP